MKGVFEVFEVYNNVNKAKVLRLEGKSLKKLLLWKSDLFIKSYSSVFFETFFPLLTLVWLGGGESQVNVPLEIQTAWDLSIGLDMNGLISLRSITLWQNI